MGMNMKSITLSFVLLLYVSIETVQSSDGVFDVTTYGAKPNADITQVKTNIKYIGCLDIFTMINLF